MWRTRAIPDVRLFRLRGGQTLLDALLDDGHLRLRVVVDGLLHLLIVGRRPGLHRELLNHGVLKPASKGYISLVHSDADMAETAKAFDAAMAQVAHS